jgi:prepilin-type N-terminal cleavage/methylation domain-containing protein
MSAYYRAKGQIMKRYATGFTLIEIAIVLVIIGLLLAGQGTGAHH